MLLEKNENTNISFIYFLNSIYIKKGLKKYLYEDVNQ